jgi:hypothetical protein
MATFPRTLSATGGGARGYDPRFGGVPELPTSGQLSTNVQNILGQAIPGYQGLTQSASGIIGDAMSGAVPGDVQRVINNAAATQAVRSGMPGSNQISGTLIGNRSLRDLGLTSLDRQDRGVKDFISLLQGVSGTAAPTFGQAQEQENARAQYSSAPNPASAAAEQERLYNKYANPAAGTMFGSGGTTTDPSAVNRLDRLAQIRAQFEAPGQTFMRSKWA